MEENNFDLFLKLLSEAKITKDTNKLDEIEASLQKLFKDITEEVKQDDLKFKKDISPDKINMLRELIDHLNQNNNANKKLFLEFKQFIENKKFK